MLLRHWENNSFFEWGLDLLFNLTLNLTKAEMGPVEYGKDSNRFYTEIKDISWVQTSPSSINLLLRIKSLFNDKLK